MIPNSCGSKTAEGLLSSSSEKGPLFRTESTYTLIDIKAVKYNGKARAWPQGPLILWDIVWEETFAPWGVGYCVVHEERVSGIHEITLQHTTDTLYLIGHSGAQWAEQDTLFVLGDACFVLFQFVVQVKELSLRTAIVSGFFFSFFDLLMLMRCETGWEGSIMAVQFMLQVSRLYSALRSDH